LQLNNTRSPLIKLVTAQLKSEFILLKMAAEQLLKFQSINYSAHPGFSDSTINHSDNYYPFIAPRGIEPEYLCRSFNPVCGGIKKRQCYRNIPE